MTIHTFQIQTIEFKNNQYFITAQNKIIIVTIEKESGLYRTKSVSGFENVRYINWDMKKLEIHTL